MKTDTPELAGTPRLFRGPAAAYDLAGETTREFAVGKYTSAYVSGLIRISNRGDRVRIEIGSLDGSTHDVEFVLPKGATVLP